MIFRRLCLIVHLFEVKVNIALRNFAIVSAFLRTVIAHFFYLRVSRSDLWNIYASFHRQIFALLQFYQFPRSTNSLKIASLQTISII